VGQLPPRFHKAFVDAERNTVVEGYGILRPPRWDIIIQIGKSVPAGRHSFPLMRLRDLSIRAGFRGFNQEPVGEGSVNLQNLRGQNNVSNTDARCTASQGNTILSHDMIEGPMRRAGLLSDGKWWTIKPQALTRLHRRKHRWVR